jgi:hypothetical protein
MVRSNFYDSTKPLLINNNGGNDTSFLYRSILIKWTNGIVARQRNFISSLDGNSKQVVGFPLKSLYNMAYGDTAWSFPNYIPTSYGKYWFEPLLEVIDSSEFQTESNSMKNKYNYSLYVPRQKATPRYLQEIMQRDLESYFGYDVKVETRLMPYWKLIVLSEESKIKLRAKGGTPKEKSNLQRDGLTLVNHPMKALVNHLSCLDMFVLGPPLVDETGIIGNIDIEIAGILTDFHELKRGLNEIGLDLINGRKEMKVIVIKDRIVNYN